MKNSIIASVALLLASGCATGLHDREAGNTAAAVQSSNAGAASAASIVPYADYHTHISTRAAEEFILDPILPEVPVPPEVAQLLKQRMAVQESDLDAIVDLYTSDAVLLGRDGNWITGSFKIHATYWLQKMLRPADGRRIVPSRFQTNGELAYLTGTVATGAGTSTQYVGLVHMNLRKEAGRWRIAAESSAGAPPVPKEHPVEPLIAEMDAAGVKKSILMSTAFLYGSSIEESQPDEYARVMRENDWVQQQAARYPDRLVAFCGFNPLKDYAVREIARCSALPYVKGLKLHFSDSGVNLTNPDHLQRVKEVFRAANEHRMPIMAHIAILEMIKDHELGRKQAEVFLTELLPLVPDIIVQIAHMGGDTGFPRSTEVAFAVFADAMSAGDPRVRNVYFEIVNDSNADARERLVKRMRQVGMNRLLFASDRSRAGSGNPPAAEAWRRFRQLPLTEAEFRDIADNVLPYVN